MQTAGYNLATLGNHEFDYGMERALAIAKNGTSTVTLLALGACLALRRRKTQK